MAIKSSSTECSFFFFPSTPHSNLPLATSQRTTVALYLTRPKETFTQNSLIIMDNDYVKSRRQSKLPVFFVCWSPRTARKDVNVSNAGRPSFFSQPRSMKWTLRPNKEHGLEETPYTAPAAQCPMLRPAGRRPQLTSSTTTTPTILSVSKARESCEQEVLVVPGELSVHLLSSSQ